jgi:hypothetical protein
VRLCQAARQAVDGGPACVDEERGAGDVARCVAGEESDRRRHLARFTSAIEHRVAGERGKNLRWGFDWRDEWRLNDGVDTHAESSDFTSKTIPPYRARTGLGRRCAGPHRGVQRLIRRGEAECRGRVGETGVDGRGGGSGPRCRT